MSSGLKVVTGAIRGVAFAGRTGGRSRPPWDSLNLSLNVGDDPESVAANRGTVSAALGISPAWATVRQVHGAAAAIASDPAPPGQDLAQADALVTGRPGLPLAIMTADCVPIAISGRGAAGAVHAGWRGMVQGVIAAGASTLRGLTPSSLEAWIGPCIGPCHYTVGEDLVEAFTEADPALGRFASRTYGGLVFDLRGAARHLLEREGVAVAGESGDCTACDPGFFSYRRDGPCGRNALLVTAVPV